MRSNVSGIHDQIDKWDWLYAACLAAGAGIACYLRGQVMDHYETALLLASVPALAWLGWSWKPIRVLGLCLVVLPLLAIWLYAGDLAAADKHFLLKYLLSSQSAILWMSVSFLLSAVFYWIGLLRRAATALSMGRLLSWVAVMLGFTGLLVRWHESYLLGADMGYIPVSNLYEVFVLFCLITALFYLYYEDRFGTRQLGAFVLLVISAAVFFLLWYVAARDGAVIQPLVAPLQSWWMKVHVPANFIGYGTFALAAMVACAYLLKSHGCLADRLPALDVLDDVMYKAISVGFAFFTVATILGALWAAEAWGGYWSWDPKETWALVVWLNYAAWLHARLVKGLRGRVAAWWALVGLLVTTFAFIGVNIFLSGLHSYGAL